MIDGFTWACEFGRNSVVDFLLQKGMNVDAKLTGGETGLHWAAYEGHADTVKLLLERGATVDPIDSVHQGTPLGWALYAWGNSTRQRSYYEVVGLLARGGAKLDPQWYADDEDRRRAAEKMQSDPRMLAALAGKLPPS